VTPRLAAVLTAAMACVACARGGEDRLDTTGLAATPPADSGAVSPVPAPAQGTPDTSVRRPSPSLPAPRPSGGASATPPAARPTEPASSDTARGIVAVVGAVPITEVVLRQPNARSIRPTGSLAREIGVASGADVWVRGRRVDARTIDVASYAVRSVDGVTAITGTLAADGDRLVLVSDDGRRHPIARPPAPLREHVGARVWITGDLGTTINAYGVLRPRR
jgi:hypothetical protein